MGMNVRSPSVICTTASTAMSSLSCSFPLGFSATPYFCAWVTEQRGIMQGSLSTITRLRAKQLVCTHSWAYASPGRWRPWHSRTSPPRSQCPACSATLKLELPTDCDGGQSGAPSRDAGRHHNPPLAHLQEESLHGLPNGLGLCTPWRAGGMEQCCRPTLPMFDGHKNKTRTLPCAASQADSASRNSGEGVSNSIRRQYSG